MGIFIKDKGGFMDKIKNDVRNACLEIIEKSDAKEGEVFVLGGSS